MTRLKNHPQGWFFKSKSRRKKHLTKSVKSCNNRSTGGVLHHDQSSFCQQPPRRFSMNTPLTPRTPVVVSHLSRLALLSSLVALAACGGGGGAEAPSFVGGGGNPAPAPSPAPTPAPSPAPNPPAPAPAPVPSGSLTAASAVCTVATGSGSCVVDVTVGVKNVTGDVKLVSPDGTSVAAGDGAQLKVTVPLGTQTYRLVAGSSELAALSLTASCAAISELYGLRCVTPVAVVTTLTFFTITSNGTGAVSWPHLVKVAGVGGATKTEVVPFRNDNPGQVTGCVIDSTLTPLSSGKVTALCLVPSAAGLREGVFPLDVDNGVVMLEHTGPRPAGAVYRWDGASKFASFGVSLIFRAAETPYGIFYAPDAAQHELRLTRDSFSSFEKLYEVGFVADGIRGAVNGVVAVPRQPVKN